MSLLVINGGAVKVRGQVALRGGNSSAKPDAAETSSVNLIIFEFTLDVQRRVAPY
jgi:hypothetical protein